MNSTQNTAFPMIGSYSKSVEIIEFGDFTCPQSRSIRKLIDTVLSLFTNQLSYSYHHFPIRQGDQSLLAAVAAEAARRQGKFVLMSQGLFSLTSITCSTLSTLALQIGLDQQQFFDDLLDDRLYDLIKVDWKAGVSLGVNATPTVFVGGQQFHGKLTVARLVPIIRSHLQQIGKPALSSVDKNQGIIYWSNNEFG
ncbi:DsbA family protein [Spirosoma endbachense]|uniref:Thioredoxin domain-containing protein n=1 Tax=Spirosoma endbachense TaxID=2666025 RepID=A0A6P1VXT7_9BACT|nr:thioredoxin domain-containing protein [Spirosoma endbachense]QHV96640.1 thioredoxin domain-containing protein [Spirosoma endbachense]